MELKKAARDDGSARPWLNTTTTAAAAAAAAAAAGDGGEAAAVYPGEAGTCRVRVLSSSSSAGNGSEAS